MTDHCGLPVPSSHFKTVYVMSMLLGKPTFEIQVGYIISVLWWILQSCHFSPSLPLFSLSSSRWLLLDLLSLWSLSPHLFSAITPPLSCPHPCRMELTWRTPGSCPTACSQKQKNCLKVDLFFLSFFAPVWYQFKLKQQFQTLKESSW